MNVKEQRHEKVQEFAPKIIMALNDEKYKWRTPKGIAKQVGCREKDVLSVIFDKQDMIVKSSVPSTNGEPLFSTRVNYYKHRSFIDGILGGLKGRVR